MNKPIKIVCGHCNSQNVRRDAWAEWDVAAQKWVLGAVFDHGHCEECEDESSLKNVEIEEDESQHFIQVEYDLSFFGGDYSGVGQYAYIPASLVNAGVSVEGAFKAKTGIDPVHIIHYSTDDLYDAKGEPVEA